MSALTKVFIVLTSVLSIVVSVLFVATAAQWAETKELVDTYQVLEKAAVTERRNLQAIMEASLAMKDDALQQKTQALEAARNQVQDLLNDLSNARSALAVCTNDKAAADAGRKKLEEIVDVQTVELTALQKQNQMLLTQNIDLQTRNTRLNSRVLELTSTVTIQNDQRRNLQEKLYACEQENTELQQSLASGRRVLPRGEEISGRVAPVAVSVVGPIRGEIMEVDGSYASINVGDTSGVVEGMTFMVYRGSTFIAELVIDSVRPKQAGGKLKTVQQQVNLGDAVAFGLEGTGG